MQIYRSCVWIRGDPVFSIPKMRRDGSNAKILRIYAIFLCLGICLGNFPAIATRSLSTTYPFESRETFLSSTHVFLKGCIRMGFCSEWTFPSQKTSRLHNRLRAELPHPRRWSPLEGFFFFFWQDPSRWVMGENLLRWFPNDIHQGSCANQRFIGRFEYLIMSSGRER
jgi:hypothetical protein